MTCGKTLEEPLVAGSMLLLPGFLIVLVWSRNAFDFLWCFSSAFPKSKIGSCLSRTGRCWLILTKEERVLHPEPNCSCRDPVPAPPALQEGFTSLPSSCRFSAFFPLCLFLPFLRTVKWLSFLPSVCALSAQLDSRSVEEKAFSSRWLPIPSSAHI